MSQKTFATEEEVLAEVSADRLMEDTRGIARGVRLSGTREELEALEYVRGVLEGAGLETTVLQHDAYISLPGSASMTILSHEPRSVSCITHSFAQTTPPEGLEGWLIDIGAGTPDLLTALDLRGKLAIVDGLAMPGKVHAIEEAGATGQIYVNAAHTHEMIVSIVWGNPTLHTVRALPRSVVVSVTKEEGQHLRQVLAKGPTRARIHTRVDTGWRRTPLLTADLRGETEQFVLLSGHIDSWHYGAMDNGSANAAMIETARLLARRREQLKRGLRLAFWSGHSHGRYSGSAWYADTHWEELRERCVAHVNVDSLGGRGATVLTESLCMAEGKRLAREVISKVTGDHFEGSFPTRAGDQSFWGIGIPSLFMTLSEQPPSDDPTATAFALLMGTGKSGGLGWWWHTTEDTVDKVDPDFLTRDAKIYVGVIWRLCSLPVPPLDYAEAAREMLDNLRALQQRFGGAFDLTEGVLRAEQLHRAAVSLMRAVERVNDEGEVSEDSQRLTGVVMSLGRTLLAPYYTTAGQFGHDPGIPVRPFPRLQPATQMSMLDPRSDDFKFLVTDLQRARNEVYWALKSALLAIEDALRDLGGT